MPTFEVALKKIRYGYALVHANSKEDAEAKVKGGNQDKTVIYPEEDTVQLGTDERKEEDLEEELN